MTVAPLREPSLWMHRWANWTAKCGIAGAVLALIGSYGTGFGLWHFVIGFAILAIAFLLAFASLFTGAIGLIKSFGTNFDRRWLLFGLLCSFCFLGVSAQWIVPGWGAPAIHDATTNLANPPAFQKIKLRSDILSGAGTPENWRRMHAKTYNDLQPLYLKASQADVRKAVEDLVKERAWEIALAAADRIEATAIESPFRFRDDVVILITPNEEDSIQQVDMRSVSRVGAGDMGVNARRIREFLIDLRASGKMRSFTPNEIMESKPRTMAAQGQN
jgi:uncharacterized protein (DUF1499 family)